MLSIQAVALSVVLAGCSKEVVGPEQMANDIRATLAATPPDRPQSASVDIAAGFGPALKSAVENNERYRAALALEGEALASIGVARSARRPQIQGQSVAGGIRETGTAQNSESTGVSGGINLSQLIYDGGESAASLNSATAEALGAGAERETTANDVAFEAARAWIDVWQHESRLDLLQLRTSEMKEVLSQIERMAMNGMIDSGALDSARRQIVDIALEETRLKSDLQQANVRFARYFNQSPKSVRRPAELVGVTEAIKLAGAFEQAPSLKRVAAGLIVARNAVLGAKSAFKPKARLQAGVTAPMQRGESTDTTLGLGIQYTFGDGGRRKAVLAAAEARVEGLEVQLADARKTLEAELDGALSQLTAIEASLPLVRRQIELSGSEAKTTQSQLATGQANLRQLIEAKAQNYHASDRLISLQAEKISLQLLIASRTGALARFVGVTTPSAN